MVGAFLRYLIIFEHLLNIKYEGHKKLFRSSESLKYGPCLSPEFTGE